MLVIDPFHETIHFWVDPKNLSAALNASKTARSHDTLSLFAILHRNVDGARQFRCILFVLMLFDF
jgi:hypothetical protein